MGNPKLEILDWKLWDSLWVEEYYYFCFMATREMIIRKVRELARARYPDAEIYLYGSQARGDARPFSDWDLLVLLNAKLIPFEVETRIMDEFYEIELETGEVISPLIYPKEAWENRHSHTPLFQNIEKEAIRLQ